MVFFYLTAYMASTLMFYIFICGLILADCLTFRLFGTFLKEYISGVWACFSLRAKAFDKIIWERLSA